MDEKKQTVPAGKGDTPARIPYPETRTKIQLLPDDLKSELDSRLSAGTFRSCRSLSKWLRDNGYQISEDSLQRYGQNFDRRLDAIRLATEQARIVCAQFKDDDVDMQTALLRLVQTRLFEILSAINQRARKRRATSGSEKIATVNITALARSVSGLARAESENRKWAEKARAAVAMATKKLDEARDKGLSKNAAAQIRAVLMEI
jgi:RNA polymerase-interacting CarD/CdnL/TRCF family regulator